MGTPTIWISMFESRPNVVAPNPAISLRLSELIDSVSRLERATCPFTMIESRDFQRTYPGV